MQGDLAQIHVAEILLNLHRSVRTGILRLSQGDVRKGIYFKDGAIVFAHSNIKSERLGETLLRLGKITDEEFRVASIEVTERGRRLGRTLFEKLRVNIEIWIEFNLRRRRFDITELREDLIVRHSDREWNSALTLRVRDCIDIP